MISFKFNLGCLGFLVGRRILSWTNSFLLSLNLGHQTTQRSLNHAAINEDRTMLLFISKCCKMQSYSMIRMIRFHVHIFALKCSTRNANTAELLSSSDFRQLTLYLTNILTLYLAAFYLTSSLTFYLTYIQTVIWCSIWHVSGSVRALQTIWSSQ